MILPMFNVGRYPRLPLSSPQGKKFWVNNACQQGSPVSCRGMWVRVLGTLCKPHWGHDIWRWCYFTHWKSTYENYSRKVDVFANSRSSSHQFPCLYPRKTNMAIDKRTDRRCISCWKTVKHHHPAMLGNTVDGQKSCTTWYGKYPVILQGFIHVRWLGMGFLNHQQYQSLGPLFGDIFFHPKHPLSWG